MNSANSEIRNSARKTHNDQKPRRLTLKLSQRRRLSGDSAKRRKITGWRLPTGVSTATSEKFSRFDASTSDLPRLEVDARIDPSVGQIGDQVHHHADEREDVELSLIHISEPTRP